MIKEDKKKKLVRNYIILIVIFVAVIGVILYLCKWYKVYDDYKKQTPVIRGTLQEIVNDDLEHYLLDNPTSIIYMCTSNDDNCREFEKSFSKYVVKNDLSSEIIYLNLTNTDKDKFVNDFNNKHKFKVKLDGNFPAFVVFRDGEVDAILQDNVTLSKVDNFLELNSLDGDDYE